MLYSYYQGEISGFFLSNAFSLLAYSTKDHGVTTVLLSIYKFLKCIFHVYTKDASLCSRRWISPLCMIASFIFVFYTGIQRNADYNLCLWRNKSSHLCTLVCYLSLSLPVKATLLHF